jgi:hypothetical protein
MPEIQKERIQINSKDFSSTQVEAQVVEPTPYLVRKKHHLRNFFPTTYHLYRGPPIPQLSVSLSITHTQNTTKNCGAERNLIPIIHTLRHINY